MLVRIADALGNRGPHSMAEKRITELVDPAQNVPLDQWLSKIDDIAEDRGYFEPLGPDHSAIYIEGAPVLLVTFETIATVRGRADSDVPLGWELASKNNWSQLCLLSHSDTWFRHRAIYQYFDRLVDDGFFEDFEKVVFYGSGSCGYGAAAFSVAAPGSTVIVLQPQATLDPRVTEWETRFDNMRRISFTDRYGYAPDMLDAADRAFVVYDPEIPEDAMHAALYTRQNVTKIRSRHVGGEIEAFMRRTGIIEPLINLAMTDKLTAGDFYKMLRERRNYLPYLRRFLGAVEEEQRPFLTGILCRSVLQRINTPRFRRQFTRAERQLKEEGRQLPSSRKLESA